VLILEELEHADAGRDDPGRADRFAETLTPSMMRLARWRADRTHAAAALADAGVGVHDVDYINAHGTERKQR